jgi:hypothetical protein
MKRIILVVAAAAVMAAMLAASALPAFAIVEPAPQSNCVALEAVLFDLREGFHGEGGQRSANEAQLSPGFVGELASTGQACPRT